nr:piggyBac transposable element-derived protein 4-like [Hydra vulgaris]
MSDSEESFTEEESYSGSDDDVLDLWLPVVGDDNGPNVFAFTGVPGPKHTISPESKPIDYVELFFTIEFLEKLVTYTNQYADAWIQSNQQHLRSHPLSIGHVWIKQGKSNLLEIKAFLGVVINMGLIKKASIKLYWDISHPCASTPWFVTHFNRDHESMIGYKGKTPHLRQYMPNKRHSRFGIKLWCVSDSTNGYLSKFEIYKGGKNPDEAVIAHGMTYNLVFRLLRQANLLHQGYHLGIDNYYTSPQLLLDLYLHQTTATGTVRVNIKRSDRNLP